MHKLYTLALTLVAMPLCPASPAATTAAATTAAVYQAPNYEQFFKDYSQLATNPARIDALNFFFLPIQPTGTSPRSTMVANDPA